ncbi:hypothetical protein B0H19DRAFT_1276809 [Mycena capillaripes]|nr:hypothetical protein B0H19DRAFT_1276809 [Mycena capillaripes]
MPPRLFRARYPCLVSSCLSFAYCSPAPGLCFLLHFPISDLSWSSSPSRCPRPTVGLFVFSASVRDVRVDFASSPTSPGPGPPCIRFPAPAGPRTPHLLRLPSARRPTLPPISIAVTLPYSPRLHRLLVFPETHTRLSFVPLLCFLVRTSARGAWTRCEF